jgi:hypothetical protein
LPWLYPHKPGDETEVLVAEDGLPKSLRPQDQHLIIFAPAAGYKGQDSFTLSMREHNGGRSATLSVTVSVTIQ